MKVKTDFDIMSIRLEWVDIESLKEGKTVAERYNGEHKINIGVIPDTLGLENWTDAKSVLDKVRFDEFLHEFFFDLSIYTVRNQFIPVVEFNLNISAKNPHFREVIIRFPD